MFLLAGAGRYWKNTDAGTPWILRNVIMRNNVYTPAGDFFVIGHQFFVTLTFCSHFAPESLLVSGKPYACIHMHVNACMHMHIRMHTYAYRAPACVRDGLGEQRCAG